MFELVATLTMTMTMKWMQDLHDVLMKLRDEFNYCLFCGCKVSKRMIYLYWEMGLHFFFLLMMKLQLQIRYNEEDSDFYFWIFFPPNFFSMNQGLPFWTTALESMKMTTKLKVSDVDSGHYHTCSFCHTSAIRSVSCKCILQWRWINLHLVDD